MTIWFVSRHAGAKVWAQQQGLSVDRQVNHLDLDEISAGDVVLGSLPVNLVADLNLKGADYLHLVLPLPEAMRGQAISAEVMTQLGARLEGYRVLRVDKTIEVK